MTNIARDAAPFMYAAFVKYTSPITLRAKIAIPTHIGITKNIPYLYEAVTYFSSNC